MNKSLTFQAAVITFGKIVVSGSSIVLGALLSRTLSVETYGTYRQVWLIYNLLYPVFTAGITNSINYFLPQQTKEKQKTFLFQTYFLLLFLGLFFSLLLFLGAGKISFYFHNLDLGEYFRLFAPIPLLTLSTSFYQNYFICLGKPVLASSLSIATSFLRFGLISICILNGGSLKGVFMILVFYSGLEFLIISWFLFREMKGVKRLGQWSLNEQLKFAFPLSLSSAAGSLTRQVDKLIISSFYSASLYAVYTNGAVELPIIPILTGSVMAVLIPEFVRLLQQGEKKKLVSLWHNSIRQLSLILLPSMVFLYAFSRETISILFSAKYLASVPVFRVYLCLLPARVTVFGSLLLALGRPKSILRYSIYTMIANLVLSLVLTKTLGFLGPAWATILVIYLMDFLQLREIAEQLNLSLAQAFPWWKQLKILAVSLCCLPLPLILRKAFQGDLSRLLVGASSFLVCYGSLALGLGLISHRQILLYFSSFYSKIKLISCNWQRKSFLKTRELNQERQEVKQYSAFCFKYEIANCRLVCPNGQLSCQGKNYPCLDGYLFRFPRAVCRDCLYSDKCQNTPQGKVMFVHDLVLKQIQIR